MVHFPKELLVPFSLIFFMLGECIKAPYTAQMLMKEYFPRQSHP